MEFIDIHSHILPGLDDGAKTMEASLEMARAAARGGVKDIIATPHVDLESSVATLEKLPYLLEEINRAMRQQGLEVQVHPGTEMRMNTALLRLEETPTGIYTLTLNHGGKYILIDLPLLDIPLCTEEVFFRLQLAGLTPILAHPERNRALYRQPEFILQIFQRGVKIQVNAGSLIGYYGRKTKRLGWHILESNLVHLVASDAHRPLNHGLDFHYIYQNISERTSVEQARLLLMNNPQAVLAGEPLEDPLPMSTKKRKTRWKG